MAGADRQGGKCWVGELVCRSSNSISTSMLGTYTVHTRKQEAAVLNLLFLKLLLVLLGEVLDDSLMGLHQQVVLLIPPAVQCIPLPSKGLVPAPLIHSFIHSLTHSFIHSFTHSFTHLSNHPFIHPTTHPPIHSFIHSFNHPYNHPFVRSFIHSFVHSFIHSFVICLRFLVINRTYTHRLQLLSKQRLLGCNLYFLHWAQSQGRAAGPTFPPQP